MRRVVINRRAMLVGTELAPDSERQDRNESETTSADRTLETEGFEAIGDVAGPKKTMANAFRDRPIRPLWHLSGRLDHAPMEVGSGTFIVPVPLRQLAARIFTAQGFD